MKAQTFLKAKKYTGILPFLSGICWGATGIFVRTLENAGVDNFTIISCRMLLAALITGICMLIYNRSLFHVNLKDLWLFIASGMIGMTALSIFYNISVSSSSLALAAVLLAMCPVFVLFLAAIFFHEKITGRKTGCVILRSPAASWSVVYLKKADLHGLSAASSAVFSPAFSMPHIALSANA